MTVDVSQSSFVIGATIVAAVVGILSRSFISTFRDWSDAKRRTAVERDDADIADLKRQVDGLKDALEAERSERLAQREFLRLHAEWDRKAYNALVRAGIDIELPPNLL